MDNKPPSGHRIQFSAVVAQVPIRLVGSDGRQAVVFSNTGGSDVRIGHSGSLATQGMILPAGQGFTDTYTAEEWWAVSASSSGTVSGFIVL